MVASKRLLLPVLCALALIVTPFAISTLSAQSTTPQPNPATAEQPNPALPSDVNREKPASDVDLEQSPPQAPAPAPATTPAPRQAIPSAPPPERTPSTAPAAPGTIQQPSRSTTTPSEGQLPRTAGEMPLIGLIGVLSLSARMALLKFRR